MAVKIVNLVKRYDRTIILDHLSVEAQEGEIFGLFGTNGSGKTTLVNCLMGILKYDKGEITIDGEKLFPGNLELKRKIGFVPQEIAVLKELTVYENIAYFCSLYVDERSREKELAEEAVKMCGLSEVRTLLPSKLNFSFLKRLNMACGIAGAPKLLVVDEPVSGVDSMTKELLLQAIRVLNKQGTTVLYASNDIEELAHICSRMAILFKGRVILTASEEELKALVGEDEKVVIEVFRITSSVLEEIEKMPGVSYVNCLNNEV
ncbi:MAG TPA: ABC transporter ATP-binding protein, partial [Lachnospiraceae bacterium]|nr:ABC transporter ATP-binding protein [Lachnospiraceae bacterium]